MKQFLALILVSCFSLVSVEVRAQTTDPASKEPVVLFQDGESELDKQELEFRGRPYGEIEPIVSDNYHVYCWSTKENAEFYSAVMEALYEKYNDVFPEQHFPRRPPPGGKSNVWIYANYDQFLNWTGVQRGVGGFFRTSDFLRDVTAYHGSFGASGGTVEVLAHEGTHQFQAMIFPNFRFVPTWTIEGMAVYFGDGSELERRGSLVELEINKIPRDRLIGLQQAMVNGSYCPLRRLLRLSHAQFSGFFYSHGWGIFYWAFWGNKADPPAYSDKRGTLVMNDWVIYCKEIDKFDLEAHAQKFESILAEHTGKGLDEWEEDYKEWIQKLKAESLFDKRGRTWESEKLRVRMKQPSGWKRIKDADLRPQENIAFVRVAKKPERGRIFVSVDPKGGQDLSVTLIERVLRTRFDTFEPVEGGELREEQVHGKKAIVGTFKGKVSRRRLPTGEQSPEAEERMYKIVVLEDIERLYTAALEANFENFDITTNSFDTFLEDFEVIF